MTRSELIDPLVDANPHLRHGDIERVVDVIFDTMSEAMFRG